MPKGGKRRIRMNRAVGLFNKADEFNADPQQYDSLVGAGYAEAVSEPDPGASIARDTSEHARTHEGQAHFTMDMLVGGDDGDPVRGEPDNDEDRAA